jgi:hypothetical protein
MAAVAAHDAAVAEAVRRMSLNGSMSRLVEGDNHALLRVCMNDAVMTKFPVDRADVLPRAVKAFRDAEVFRRELLGDHADDVAMPVRVAAMVNAAWIAVDLTTPVRLHHVLTCLYQLCDDVHEPQTLVEAVFALGLVDRMGICATYLHHVLHAIREDRMVHYFCRALQMTVDAYDVLDDMQHLLLYDRLDKPARAVDFVLEGLRAASMVILRPEVPILEPTLQKIVDAEMYSRKREAELSIVEISNFIARVNA